MELVSIGKFAKMVGVTTTTLRRMHQSGDFIPYHVTKGGTRYYSMEQLKEFSNAPKTEKLVVGYCRVSTPAQKNDYASSKTCSYCGHIKKDLKLSERIYVCPNCGAKLNRDLNAAINLANYKTA